MSETPYSKQQQIELTITDFAEKEQCFGRLDDGMGVMVRGMLAIGDRVSATIRKVKKRYLEATLDRILEPSPDRVEPVCPWFGTCGGCKLMHVGYPTQLAYKAKKVRDALVHLGGFQEPLPMLEPLAAPEEHHYRNKVEFSCSSMRYLLQEELLMEQLEKPKGFALGFHAPGNFEKVIDIDYCYLANEPSNRALRLTHEFARAEGLSPYAVRAHEGYLRNLVLRYSEDRHELMVNIVTSWYDKELMERYRQQLEAGMEGVAFTLVNNVTSRRNTVATGEQEYFIAGSGTITERLGTLRFRISANSFFQTNTKQAETLYDAIVRVARLGADSTVYDLYCGTGTITLYLAAHCRRAIGLEVVESSVLDAKANADYNGVENAEFIMTDLKELHAVLPAIEHHGPPSVIITDPPRAGMHPKALKTMLQLGAERIVYVSCNPASLGRDGAIICQEGYRLASVQPVDMFPQTNHIESVACFERVAGE